MQLILIFPSKCSSIRLRAQVANLQLNFEIRQNGKLKAQVRAKSVSNFPTNFVVSIRR